MPRVGETLSNPRVLDALGLSGLEDVPAVSFVGTRSAWGSAESHERSSILNAYGAGLHLDRAAFDEWLIRGAIDIGVCVRRCSSSHLSAVGDGWSVTLDNEEIAAEFLMDARGRSSTVNVPARKWIAFDRLVGVVGWMHPDEGKECEPELLIESMENGWWYSAPQPGGGLVATLMTDADLIEGDLPDFWTSTLKSSPLTRERLKGFSLTRDLAVRRAESGYSLPDRGENWRAIGDAACAWDPLAGAGIVRALESGMTAAPELLSDSSHHETEAPLNYLETRARYYGMERRWPESLFWKRRHSPSLENFEVFLDPSAVLASNASVSREMLARAESLIPPRAIRDLLARMKEPIVAHDAMGLLRELCGPLGDVRLLGGLQLLILDKVTKEC